VLVLVVVLVLDPWDPILRNYFVHHFDREICRVLEDEQEHEHDFSTSASRVKTTFVTSV
jgi:hypothetical protein